MLSPETRKLMMQTYEDWIKHPPAPTRTLETMKWAYQQTCAGKDPWTGLGSFSHAWHGYAKDRRVALVAEPLAQPVEETAYNQRWAAFCAASVEFLCQRDAVPCPDWVSDPAYNLKDPWWHIVLVDNQTVREYLQRTTPVPFTNRNIFCGNRLFQNKYEL